MDPDTAALDGADAFAFDLMSDSAPHDFLHVNWSRAVFAADLIRDQEVLDDGLLQGAFGAFLARCRVDPGEAGEMVLEFAFPRESMRELVVAALPEETVQHGLRPPEPGQIHVPLAHVKALHPDSVLVKGIRGAGKTLRWEALLDKPHRALIEAVAPRTGISAGTRCSAGFGVAAKPHDYPDADTLAELMERGQDPRQIWRAIIARHVLTREEAPEFLALTRWSERAQWISADSERRALAFYAAEQRLTAAHAMHLVLFDALDRTASDWPGLRHLLRGLLQVLLEFRSYRAIRPKVFVRPDMLDDPEVKNFPDASKLIDNAVALTMRRSNRACSVPHRFGCRRSAKTTPGSPASLRR